MKERETIKSLIRDRVYWRCLEFGMDDKYGIDEIAENFWKEVIRKRVKFNEVDDYFDEFILEIRWDDEEV